MVNKLDILNSLQSFIAMFTNNNELHLDYKTSFENIKNWDSLAFISTISVIQEQYNIKLSTDEILKIHSIGELVEIIAQNLE